VRYAPVLHLQKGLKPTVVVEAVLEGLRAATRETGISPACWSAASAT